MWLHASGRLRMRDPLQRIACPTAGGVLMSANAGAMLQCGVMNK
jgi:hypothetical protein